MTAPAPARPLADLLAQVLGAVPDVVAVKDRDQRYLVANAACAAVIGRAVEEIVGRTDEELYPPTVAAALRAVDQRVIATGEVVTATEWVPSARDGGAPRAWTSVKAPLRDAAGAVVGVVVTARDETTRHRLEAEREHLLAAERAARARAEALQALTASLARAATVAEVVAAAVRDGGRAVGATGGGLALLEDGGATFRLVAGPGITPEVEASWQRWPNAGTLPGPEAVRTGAPAYSRTRAEYVARDPGLAAVAASLGLEAEATLPLVVARTDRERGNERIPERREGGEHAGRAAIALGVLTFLFATPQAFGPADDAYLRAVADLTAQALERARLFEAERATAEALRASEDELRARLDLSPQVAWTGDPDGTIRGVGARWLALAGLTEAAPSDARWEPVVHPDDLERTRDAWTASIATGRDYDIEHRVRRPQDGAWRWMRSRAYPRRDPQTGAVVKWYGTTEDVHDRHVAEAALRASERRFRRLFEADVAGVIFADVSGRVLEANDAFLAMLGYARADVAAGRLRWDAITPPRWRAVDAEIAAALLRDGAAPPVEKTYLARDGREVPVLVGGALLDGAEGRRPPDGGAHAPDDPAPDDPAPDDPAPDDPAPVAVAFVVDLTEQKRAEAAVRALAADLERQVEARTRDLRAANADLEAFTYSVSHDLRAPLRALQGFAAALDEDYGDRLDADGRAYTGFLAAAARQMDQLIQDLLAYSRMGRAALALGPVDLAAAVAEARAQVAAALDAAGAEVVVDLAGGCAPGERGGPHVLGERVFAVQAVANYLTNAAKFVRPGARARVRLTAERRQTPNAAPARVRLVVEDGGVGVAAEHRDRIFRVFERLHGADEYPGTGIGLAIVARAAERAGGAAGVDPAPGGGSRFWIEWRAAAPDVATPRAAAGSMTSPTAGQ